MTEQVAGHQEGSRWIHAKPSGAEVAKWFVENAPLHDGMDANRYVSGVTLIPAKEKVRTEQMDDAGATQLVETEQLVYTPYVKVETRVLYFWDYVALHPEWVGAIEPVLQRTITTEPYANEHLPDGFFRYPVVKADGKTVHYLGCSARVRIFERDVRSGGRGRLLMEPLAGSKIVAQLNRWGEDPHALMKAETGAAGRALGFAGMLVLPGSGVATAEDMQEAPAGDSGEPAGDATLPATEASGAEAATVSVTMTERAKELLTRLEAEHPEKFAEVQAWARERRPPLVLDELTEESPALRGVVKQLERKLEEAKAEANGG